MILMVTALNELGDIERAVEAGTDDFLSKPVNKLELLKRVENMLKLHHVTDEVERLRQYIAEMEDADRPGQSPLAGPRTRCACHSQRLLGAGRLVGYTNRPSCCSCCPRHDDCCGIPSLRLSDKDVLMSRADRGRAVFQRSPAAELAARFRTSAGAASGRAAVRQRRQPRRDARAVGAFAPGNNPRRFSFLHLAKNGGKAEAVRQGMLLACNPAPTMSVFGMPIWPRRWRTSSRSAACSTPSRRSRW